ncbi:MAG: 50S ribosomal protein L24 [Puniceicoccales bacterium]|jgi:large subunit ribosomal protein L24|nr:50S ribosomal protein L24 [Puniceicoccales bacterium]
MKYSIKKGDDVVVISGSNRGERGRVIRVLRDSCRVTIEGVALRKKFVKKSQTNPEGGEIKMESAIHYSNVMLASRYDSKRTKPVK